jgi:hypothetical protein
MTQTAANSSLIAALEAIAAEAPESGLTLAELFARLGDRAFGAIMFTLAIPAFIPVAGAVVSIPMLVLAGQMAAGRAEPWLPPNLGARRIEKTGLRQMARFARRWLGWLEKLARGRYQRFTGMWGERVCGVLFIVFAVSILIPLFFSNGVPATAILVASLGLIMSDGVLVLLGLIVGGVWVAMLAAAVGFGGTAAITAIIGFAAGAFGG